jgi:hypothetical protein
MPGQTASDFLAARLVYRMIGLALGQPDAPLLLEGGRRAAATRR